RFSHPRPHRASREPLHPSVDPTTSQLRRRSVHRPVNVSNNQLRAGATERTSSSETGVGTSRSSTLERRQASAKQQNGAHNKRSSSESDILPSLTTVPLSSQRRNAFHPGPLSPTKRSHGRDRNPHVVNNAPHVDFSKELYQNDENDHSMSPSIP